MKIWPNWVKGDLRASYFWGDLMQKAEYVPFNSVVNKETIVNLDLEEGYIRITIDGVWYRITVNRNSLDILSSNPIHIMPEVTNHILIAEAEWNRPH